MLIKKAEYIISATKKSNFPDLPYPQFGFLGRSNVGKSSFINALTNRKNLAYTSSRPGKTITLNFYVCNDSITLIDVPGYGYAQQLKTDRLAFGAMIENLIHDNELLKMIFLIVDIRHKPTEDDKMMYEYLKHYNIPTTIIATKADKVGKTLIYRHVKEIKQELNLSQTDKIIPFSSETKYGLTEVELLIENILNN